MERASINRPMSRGVGIIGCAVIVVALVAKADPVQPVIPTNPNNDPAYYDITKYGASAGATAAVNAAAITSALTACSGAGGGTVVVPAGTFNCAPLDIVGVSNVNFEVNGTLQAPTAANFGTNPAGSYFIYWKNGTNIELSGSGKIDGNGASWWGNGQSAPKLVNFSGAVDCSINNITVQNSPKENFTFTGTKTHDVTFNNVTVSNPASSPNTDGIDPNGANFLINNCNISTGDDDIALKATGGNAACKNITITNCTFGSGHGLSIGGQTNLGVDGVTVSDCTFNGTQFGIRLKAGRGVGGLVQNLSYSNLTMTNVGEPIYISSWYANGGFVYPSSPAMADTQPFDPTTTPVWQNISINNLTATDLDSNSTAGLIYGLPEAYVQNVQMNNVNISAGNGMEIDYADGISFGGNWSITPQQGDPLKLFDATVNVPEPATIGLMAMGLSGLARRRRC